MSEFERKPDGGLSAWIETYEAMGGGENDAEMLCLLLELRRRRANEPELKEKLESAERERDERRESLAVMDGHLSASRALKQLWKNRAWDAEEEIARRDAVSFEMKVHNSGIGKSGPWVKLNDQRAYEKLKLRHSGDADYEFRELYTAAPSAVVSDEMLRELLRTWDRAEFKSPDVYQRMREVLGAQPQKPVALPESVRINNGYYFNMDDIFAALDAANVPWR